MITENEITDFLKQFKFPKEPGQVYYPVVFIEKGVLTWQYMLGRTFPSTASYHSVELSPFITYDQALTQIQEMVQLSVQK